MHISTYRCGIEHFWHSKLEKKKKSIIILLGYLVTQVGVIKGLMSSNCLVMDSIVLMVCLKKTLKFLVIELFFFYIIIISNLMK